MGDYEICVILIPHKAVNFCIVNKHIYMC